MSQAYNTLFTAVLLALGVMMIACLVRAILGPRIADRLVSINMTGTIAIIYAMLSFLAVVVLVKVFIGVYAANKEREKEGAER